MKTVVHMLIDDRTGAKLEVMTAPPHACVQRGMVIRVKVEGEVTDLKVMSVHHDPISENPQAPDIVGVHVRRLNWLERAGAWVLDRFGRAAWCA